MKTDIDKETKEKINNLQLLDQKLQSSLMRKQVFQSQLLETENTLAEIKGDVKEIYKIVGNVMISTNSDLLKKEIESNKSLIEARIKNIEKEESLLRKNLTEIQEDVMKRMKNDTEK